jgi:hypothetical protein
MVGDDRMISETTLTLNEEDFNQYKARGYLNGVQYSWTSQGDVYKLVMSRSSYDKLKKNMESTGWELIKKELVVFD